MRLVNDEFEERRIYECRSRSDYLGFDVIESQIVMECNILDKMDWCALTLKMDIDGWGNEKFTP